MHATHTMHALPDLRVAAGRLAGRSQPDSQITRALGNRNAEASSLWCMSSWLFGIGEYEQATTAAIEALAIYEQTNKVLKYCAPNSIDGVKKARLISGLSGFDSLSTHIIGAFSSQRD